jgi:hypothetical protein
MAALQQLERRGNVRLADDVRAFAFPNLTHQIQGRVVAAKAYRNTPSDPVLAAMPPIARARYLKAVGVLTDVEGARRPGAAIPMTLRDVMHVKDPEHPDISTHEQMYGGAPSPLDKPSKGPAPLRGVQNPAAPVGSGGVVPGEGNVAEPRVHASETQKSIDAHAEFATGVISRIVIEAARGNPLYAHGANVPPEVTSGMEAFVRHAVVRMRDAASHSAEDVLAFQKLRSELTLALKAFFMRL